MMLALSADKEIKRSRTQYSVLSSGVICSKRNLEPEEVLVDHGCNVAKQNNDMLAPIFTRRLELVICLRLVRTWTAWVRCQWIGFGSDPPGTVDHLYGS